MEYNPKMKIIVDLVHILYELPDCSAGGCCHIVTDDDNIDDEDLMWVMDYCKQPENINRIDRELSYAICEMLLQLSREQRICLFYLWNAGLLNDGVDEYRWEYLFENFKTADEILADWESDWN